MRKLAAIMFTDIAGYTALMSQDEEKALQLLQKNRALLKPIIEQFRGEWLKEMGDGTLSSFASAVDAVNCALEIQHILRQDPELSLRIGIHIGDVVFERDDVFGDGVNVASRIEPLAEPGCICVSEQVYDAIRNKPGIETTSLGEQQLKGIDHPIRVFTVSEQRGILKEPETVPAKPGRPRWRVWAVAAAVAVAVAVAVMVVIYQRGEPAQAGTISSLAVLPLDNLGGDPEEEYFVDGMHEAIISNLARLSALKVISRTSAMRYKDTDKLMPEIARELNVDAIVEGSVLKAGDRVRITAQLIHGASDKHLWANDYEGDLTDILSLQKTIAKAIAGEIGLALTPEEEADLANAPRVNPEAYNLYLKGWHFRNMETRESMPKAVEYLEQAVALDPDYALAWAALAHSYLLMQWQGDWSSDYAFDRMKLALDKALELDPNQAKAHAGLGVYREYVGFDIAGAETSFRRALELDPDNVYALYEYGLFLFRTGRPDEALAEFRRALELDPLSPQYLQGFAFVYFRTRQYEKALEYFQAIEELVPGFVTAHDWAKMAKLEILMQQGRYAEAAAGAGKLYAEDATEFRKWFLFLQLRAEWVLGNKEKVYSVRDSLRSTGELQQREQEEPFWSVRLYAIMGEKELALGLLERAYEDSTFFWRVLLYYPGLDSLRAEPRFKALIRKTGMTEVFDQYGQRIR